MADRRQYYRLTFPVAERPRLRLDASTTSSRCRKGASRSNWPAVSARPRTGLGVVVQMADGVELAASGSVKRQGSERLTLQFHELLPWKAGR